MNTRQIKAIRKLFLAYGQPGTVEIHRSVSAQRKKTTTGKEWVEWFGGDKCHGYWANSKSLGVLKQLPVSTGYIYIVRWSTPDMDHIKQAKVICTDLTDPKNPKFAIHYMCGTTWENPKEESANATD